MVSCLTVKAFVSAAALAALLSITAICAQSSEDYQAAIREATELYRGDFVGFVHLVSPVARNVTIAIAVCLFMFGVF